MYDVVNHCQGGRVMGFKCKKCNGEEKSTKYCFKCKKAFCDSVITVTPVQKASGPPLFTEICPECGSKSVIYYR